MADVDLPIYLDYQATTPLDPRVLDAMLPWLASRFGNPHSTSHRFGRDAAAAVEAARAQIALPIGAEPREIVFTSGATESNNLAIKGAARFLKNRRRRLVTLATEHKCVLESVLALENEGFSIEILPVDRSGLVDLDRLAATLTDDVAVVSVMMANNEIGVLQDLAAVARLARACGALVHTDAAQAYGKIPIDVDALGIDLMSISGHKIYGPKGIGALYVRRRPRARLEPLFSGGGQERGLRSGTLSPALCVGFGLAAEIAHAERPAEAARLEALAGRLLAGLPAATLNGDPVRRLPGSLNLAFEGVPAMDLLAATPELALSTGSACTSATLEPSYVLQALGVGRSQAENAFRLSLGRFTTERETDLAARYLTASVAELRARPLSAAALDASSTVRIAAEAVPE
jgi:cysteine desulfurase